MPRRHSDTGFTLVEVLVALAILGLVAGAVLTLAAQTARFAGDEESRLMANILLDNTMVETMGKVSALERGDDEIEAEFAGRRWKIERHVADTNVKGLAGIEIKVLGAGGRVEASATTLKVESQ